MQNGSVLSKPKMMTDKQKALHGSSGKQKRELFRTTYREGYKPHPQASAIYFLV